MEQYINKAALVSEIERRMQELHPTNTHQIQVGEKMDRDVLMWLNALTWVKNFLNTLEVKEEVTTTDAFINKACEFLKSYRQDTCDGIGYISGIVNDKTIEDFKKYMKGE